MKHLIAPSVLAANFARLQDEIEMVNYSEADLFHVDIMDGVFVPNLSFGFPVVEAIAKYATKPLDVHLMISDPDRYLSRFVAAGAATITVHYEACTHLHRTVTAIREAGCRAGVALNPHTPVELLSEIIENIDVVLLMSVNPGFGGQKFIPRTFDKIRRLRQLAKGRNDELAIEIDGGVDRNNALDLLNAGADILVAGNFVFSSDAPLDVISELKHLQPAITRP